MTDDVWSDPEVQAWRERANRDLRPMVENSTVATLLWSEVPDAKMAVELGFILLLGKPLVILKDRTRGPVPAHLARLATEVIEYDDLDESVIERLAMIVKRMEGEDGAGDQRQP